VDSDRALVDAAAAGDREAYDELVRRYQVQILSLARALLGGSADAEDIAQEVFVRAWRSIRGFRGEGTFRAWLHRVAVNLLHSHQRHLTRERRFFRTSDAKDNDAREAERVPSPFDPEYAVTLRLGVLRGARGAPRCRRRLACGRRLAAVDTAPVAHCSAAGHWRAALARSVQPANHRATDRVGSLRADVSRFCPMAVRHGARCGG
jgi:DNA-directed RNA polymerase specialized sigma24 family protein